MGTTADIAQFVQKTTFDEFDPEARSPREERVS